MSRRGSELREHILITAKSVFLEVGFERASMDMIAARAQTSKRTLYAHFESKERLYLAIIDVVREMYLSRLKSPAEYSAEPAEALVLFCGKYLSSLLFVWTVRMCRLSIAEAERFPEGSAQYFDVVFTIPQERVAAYLQAQFRLPAPAATEAAQHLLGQVIFPLFPFALFGIGTPAVDFGADLAPPEVDLAPIRLVVANLIKAIC